MGLEKRNPIRLRVINIMKLLLEKIGPCRITMNLYFAGG